MARICGVNVAAIGIPSSARGWGYTQLAADIFNLQFPELPSKAETREENTER